MIPLAARLGVQSLHMLTELVQPRDCLAVATLLKGDFNQPLALPQFVRQPSELEEVQFGEGPAQPGKRLQSLTPL